MSANAAAARATDLSGLPPAYLEVGSSEVFRDETLDCPARLAQAGVPMELHAWDGGFTASRFRARRQDFARLPRSLHQLLGTSHDSGLLDFHVEVSRWSHD